MVSHPCDPLNFSFLFPFLHRIHPLPTCTFPILARLLLRFSYAWMSCNVHDLNPRMHVTPCPYLVRLDVPGSPPSLTPVGAFLHVSSHRTLAHVARPRIDPTSTTETRRGTRDRGSSPFQASFSTRFCMAFDRGRTRFVRDPSTWGGSRLPSTHEVQQRHTSRHFRQLPKRRSLPFTAETLLRSKTGKRQRR